MLESGAARPLLLAVLLGVVGSLVAAVVGLLTFGGQATSRPDHLPLAVSVPPAGPAFGPLRGAADRVAQQGGNAVSWRVVTADEGRSLLTDKQVYGVLELAPSSGGGLAVTVVLSGAINPHGTQFAQQVLTAAAQGVGTALGSREPAQVVTVHPASVAARIAPLAASALLWLGGLVAALGLGLLTVRRGFAIGPAARAVLVATVSTLVVAVVTGLVLLWDSTVAVGADAVGFLLLTAVAFTAVQGALLRLLRLRAMLIIGPLYLIAPAVAGQAPELLNPAYRTLLWSWSPFRFSTEGLRSLLQGTPSAPDVVLGVLVLSTMAVAGLVVLLWPSHRRVVAPAADNADRGDTGPRHPAR